MAIEVRAFGFRTVSTILILAIGVLIQNSGCQLISDSPGEHAEQGTDPRTFVSIEAGLKAREYEVSENGRGLQAPNRAHNLRTYFRPEGIRIHDRTAAGDPELLSLELTAVGREGNLRAIDRGAVTIHGARVEIHGGDVMEWYLNTAEGLEQGFTLRNRPHGIGRLVLEVAIGNAQANPAGKAVELQTPTGRRLLYDRLEVRDAEDHELSASFQ